MLFTFVLLTYQILGKSLWRWYALPVCCAQKKTGHLVFEWDFKVVGCSLKKEFLNNPGSSLLQDSYMDKRHEMVSLFDRYNALRSTRRTSYDVFEAHCHIFSSRIEFDFVKMVRIGGQPTVREKEKRIAVSGDGGLACQFFG